MKFLQFLVSIKSDSIFNVFKKYELPKLETLRFEYMLFYGSEDRLDFSVLGRSLQGILALPSLKALTFSQYQRYEFDADLEAEGREMTKRLKELVKSMKTQGQNIIFVGHENDDEDEEEEPLPVKPRDKFEFLPEFWRDLRTEVDKKKEKPLKIKYHKKDDTNIEERLVPSREYLEGSQNVKHLNMKSPRWISCPRKKWKLKD